MYPTTTFVVESLPCQVISELSDCREGGANVISLPRYPSRAHQIRKWERGLALPPKRSLHAIAGIFEVDVRELERDQMSFVRSVEAGEGYTTAHAHSNGIQSPTSATPRDRIRVLDLFCGAGGFSFGLELTGQFVTVAGIDLLSDRIATFKANHPHATGIVADIRDFPIETLANLSHPVDLIIGGPPCQGFSSIRPFRTLTEEDKRNSLIEHFLISVATIKPRWFVFENVVGILTHRNGHVLESLLRGFKASGYNISWRVMNAASYGVPQNRERLVVVGNLIGSDFHWPEPTHRHEHKSMAGSRAEIIRTDPIFSQHLPRAITVDEAIGDLPAIRSGETSGRYDTRPQNKFQEWSRASSQTLTLHTATRHSTHMMEIIRHAGSNISAIPQHLISSGFSTCYSRLDSDSPSTTLTVNFVHPASNRCIHPIQDRALTPREGARIQSFPDSFVFRGTRAQVVKQIGNAVPPLLAHAIGEAILTSELGASSTDANSRALHRQTSVVLPKDGTTVHSEKADIFANR